MIEDSARYEKEHENNLLDKEAIDEFMNEVEDNGSQSKKGKK